MTIEEIHSLLVEKFSEKAVTGLNMESIDPWVEVVPDALPDVARFVRYDERLNFDYLNDLCGVDYYEPDPKKAATFGHEPHVEIVYQLSSFKHRHRLVLKVKLQRWKDGIEGELPQVPSMASIWQIANWHEREAYDLVGIKFIGHPNLRRILCPEDWIGHALRKDYDFPLEYHGIRGR